MARDLREDLVRQACLEAYGAVRDEGRLADRAIDFTLKRKSQLFAVERRAVADRVYAVLRAQTFIDEVLERLVGKDPRRSTTENNFLRFEIGALLDATQSGAKVTDAQRHERLVKAIAAARAQLEQLPPVERLTRLWSIPPGVAHRLFKHLGDESFALAQSLNTRAPLCVRTNTLKTTREELARTLTAEGVEHELTPLSPLGIFIQSRINVFTLESFRSGLFEVQDEGSQILGLLVDPPPTKVVDACAGAGGKALQLAAAMKNRGDLYAFDIDADRLEELKPRARRASVFNTRSLPLESSGTHAVFAELAGKCDRVLLDAPCSGTGTYRRKPDARYRFSEERLAEHTATQQQLIERFTPFLTGRGRIIYGTCSLLEDENERVIEAALAKNPGLRVLPIARVLPPALAERVQSGPYLRLFPYRHGTDGFFGAILERATP